MSAARFHAMCDLEISPSKARRDKLAECTGPIELKFANLSIHRWAIRWAQGCMNSCPMAMGDRIHAT